MKPLSEKPILFSGEMVQAILAGQKSQTRRVVKWDGPKGYPHSFDHATPGQQGAYGKLWVPFSHPEDYAKNGLAGMLAWMQQHPIYSRWNAGDHLWVRETFFNHNVNLPLGNPGGQDPKLIEYRATPRGREGGDSDDDGGWQPSIHMPRWASRLTLEITSIRVERLTEISEEDARTEGIGPDYGNPLLAFRALWNGTNGKRPGCSWEDSPWVWVLEFRRVAQ